MAHVPEARPKVVYIAGWGRSGSTLLERLMGELPGFVAVGELSIIPRSRSWVDGGCGCGTRAGDCTFWDASFRAAFGDDAQARLERFRELHRLVVRHRYLHHLVSARRPAWYSQLLEEFSGLGARLYQGILGVSGRRIVVDASKLGVEALALAAGGAVDVRVVHLVRDARAVAFSVQKQRQMAFAAPGKLQARHGLFRSITEWNLRNLAAEQAQKVLPYLLLRYEDLVTDPRRAVAAVVDLAGEQQTALDFLRDGEATLSLTHALAGNPMRAQSGAVRIRLDDEWTRKMPLSQRILVGLLTWPVQRRYARQAER